MEEQVGVADLVHAAVREQAAHVLFQFLATFERMLDAPHQFFFFDRKGIGVLGIESRPVLVFQLVFLSFDTDRPAVEVDMVEQQAVVHPEFRTAADDLAFQLELYDRDRLVHAGDQLGCLFIEGRIRCVRTRDEQFAGVVSIDFHGECRQGQEVDAIAVLKGCQIAVAHAHADHVGDAPRVAGGGPHPEDVVVAPLDVEVMVVAKRVHDDVGARPAVVDVADDVQQVDRQALDQVAHGDDEVIGPAGRNDRVDDLVHIGGLVRLVARFVEQFLDDVGELLRQGLAHFRARVFGRDVPADAHQLVQCDQIPVVQVFFALPDQFQFLFRIVDQRAKLFLLEVAQRVAEYLVHFALDCTGGIFQHMVESLVLAVDVGQEMLRPFRQVQDGLQVDDFRAGVCHRRKAACQQRQVAQVV